MVLITWAVVEIISRLEIFTKLVDWRPQPPRHFASKMLNVARCSETRPADMRTDLALRSAWRLAITTSRSNVDCKNNCIRFALDPSQMCVLKWTAAKMKLKQQALYVVFPSCYTTPLVPGSWNIVESISDPFKSFQPQDVFTHDVLEEGWSERGREKVSEHSGVDLSQSRLSK